MSGKRINIEKHISFINCDILLSFLPLLSSVIPLWKLDAGHFSFLWDYVRESMDKRMLSLVLPLVAYLLAAALGMWKFSKATKEDKNDGEALLSDFKVGSLTIIVADFAISLVALLLKQYIAMALFIVFGLLSLVFSLAFKKKFSRVI